jgi:ribosome-associated translation inhibitor RaiA
MPSSLVVVQFRGLSPSPALEALARTQAAKLEKFCSRITACRVHIESSHQHTHPIREFLVGIEIAVPGHPQVVSHASNPDAHACVREAFHQAQRQLQDMQGRAAQTHGDTVGELLVSDPD